jgi:hypothetical protein
MVLLFFLGFLLMHLRLRNRSSLVLFVSFISTVLWMTFSSNLFEICKEFIAEPRPAIESTSEAFARMANDQPGIQSIEYLFISVTLILTMVFSISFLLSAYSIPRLTTQSR